MKNIYLKLITLFIATLLFNFNGYCQFASEVIIANGENAFGAPESNIGIYNVASKTYEVIDSMKTNSVQDVFIEENLAFVSAQTKIFAYDLDTKTRTAEVDYPGVSPSKGSIFTDDNYVFVGNWYGQSDSNIYAFDKITLDFEYSVTEATTECGGGISLNDTLYIGQKNKGTIDACAPYGCYSDTTGTIILADANTGAYYRTIDLGEAGKGISQIYNEGNYLFAVCAGSDKILKIEIGTDVIEEISLPSFTQSTDLVGTKLYLDLNNKAGYYDLADGSMAMSSTDLIGEAIAYAPNSETAFSTATDFSSYGKLYISNSSINDSVDVGISPQAIALRFIPNNAPNAEDDSYSYIYTDTINEYILTVLENDYDLDNETLTITNITAPNIAGATAVVDGQNIKYTRASGIASTDYFTYTICDNVGECDNAIVHITLESLISINDLDINKINIYPNPANDFITIELNNIQFNKIEIINSIGEIVKVSEKATISLENMNKGVYFAKVYTNEVTFTSKFSIIK